MTCTCTHFSALRFALTKLASPGYQSSGPEVPGGRLDALPLPGWFSSSAL
jgi:hypothetical protein